METWDALPARRNVREFIDRPVPEEVLERILEAGRRAPSAKNWQPWDFVLVTDRAQLVELAKVWRGTWHVAGAAAIGAVAGGFAGGAVPWVRPFRRLSGRQAVGRHRSAEPPSVR